MTYQWSRQAAFIQSLYRPWSPVDGYAESEVSAAEQTLGFAFPDRLRQFYRAWGQQPGMTRSHAHLLGPQQAFARSGALHFCVENQAVGYWVLQLDSLRDADPAVYFGYADDYYEEEGVEPWKLYYPLSSFLDALTLGHAFAGGAAHGGISTARLTEHQWALIQQRWQAIRFEIAPWGVIPDGANHWTMYGVEGLAIDQGIGGCWASARTREALDDVQHTLGLIWKETWEAPTPTSDL